MNIASSFLDLSYLDVLASNDTIIHRIDPRAKVIATVIFTICVVSFPKYDILPLIPFFLFPAMLSSLGVLPLRYLARKILFLFPFIMLVAIFNPVLDTTPMVQAGPVAISGGWISFVSIIIRFTLTISAAFILIATTGFPQVCTALQKMGMPRVLAMQLLFLYRYIFILGDEVSRVSRARELRAGNGQGNGLKEFRAIIGHLLLRTWDRAQRIHSAMLCRGFRGEFSLRQPLKSGVKELIFITGWGGYFLTSRLIDIPQFIGRIITESCR